ncbi:leucine-rich repeat-containing protein [Elysia marginata]|uniref:Leucine-rich repeat-containing protein n=1 Tax=Elysia marginata TaxID=1093978 RepID=A0AAV4IWH7_9GAST|nr:leucine-rich repeat-containing protein [Elysia marginata]
MERERVNIKMQRHLRPLTTSSKTSSNRAGNRPNTAAPVVTSSIPNKTRSSRVSKQSLRESHMQAFGRSREFVGPDAPDGIHPVTSSTKACQHGPQITKEPTELVEEPDDICLHLDGLAEEESPPKHPTLETWLTGIEHSSDEFDTDVEDSFDTSFVPVSYLCRHLGERNIRMRHRYLGGTATKPLALAFKHNTVTENLDLSDNYIEGSGTTYIANMLKDNHFIVSLNLSNNFIGRVGAEAIAEMLESNTTLKVLALSGNQLTDKDAYSFIQPFKNNMSLVSLDLSHNEFSVLGGIHLGGALGANEGLMELDLSWNCLRKDGASAIANSLRLNTTLEVLDVSWNGFGIEGATALARSLPVNTTLKVLDLTNNRLDWKAAQKLAPGVKKNKSLETLILNMNPLGELGVESILKAVTGHSTIRCLGLEEIGLSKASVASIQQLEQKTGMIVMHGGLHGHDRTTAISNVTRLFNEFRSRKWQELRDLLSQHDEDKTGQVQVDDVKLCLRAAGLNLTNRFMDILLENMDCTHQGHIDYRAILSGEAFSDYSRRRPSRGFHLLNKAQLDDPDSDEDRKSPLTPTM